MTVPVSASGPAVTLSTSADGAYRLSVPVDAAPAVPGQASAVSAVSAMAAEPSPRPFAMDRISNTPLS